MVGDEQRDWPITSGKGIQPVDHREIPRRVRDASKRSGGILLMLRVVSRPVCVARIFWLTSSRSRIL